MGPVIDSFDRRFAALHGRSVELVGKLPEGALYQKPRELERSMAMFSCGEYVLRSAASVEQTCGGLTTRLWDDPFEWTLPEKLATRELVLRYLDEVEDARRRCFGFFVGDDDLLKQLPAPEQLKSIYEIMLETLARAEHFQGRAFAIFQMLSDEKLPRI